MIEFGDMNYLNSFLNTGAFVCAGDNVMTASWGFVGVMWRKKVLIAPIRDTRFTKEIMEQKGEFSVSVPKAGDMKAALGICGTKSGRDTNKWTAAGLEKVKAQTIDTNVVKGCEHYFECKILAELPMPKELAKQFDGMYPTADMHNFFFGEIVKEY